MINLIQTIADRVVEKVDEALKADIMHWAAIYEVRMRAGNKKIFHLEAWVVRTMSIIMRRLRSHKQFWLQAWDWLKLRNQ